jgi:glycosyltransferase involved in cell wall biosynthesis
MPERQAGNIPDISVIVPFFNEEESIRPLCAAITETLNKMETGYEILLVDDGSSDDTYGVAKDLAATDKRIKVIKFRKNYGQTPAMRAGIDLARGRILITMDGDLQNDPADIPLLLKQIEQGFDIVVGWRHKRQDKLLTRKIPSKIANWIIGKVTGVPIKDNGCSLKAYRSAVIKKIPLYSEMHRFIPAMASISGARISEVRVNHKARQFGTSKYGLSRTFKVIIDLLTIKTLISFSSRPFYWFALLSIPFLLASVFMIGSSLFMMVTDSSNLSMVIAGSGVLFGAVVIFLLGTGLLGELVYLSDGLSMRHLYRETAILKARGEPEPYKINTAGTENGSMQ